MGKQLQSDESKLRGWLLTHSGPPVLDDLRKRYPDLIDWALLDEERESLGKLLKSAMQRSSA